MKWTKALLASVSFLVTLVAIYIAHARYGHVDVVFYAALADVVVAIAVVSFFLFALRFFAVLSAFEKAQLVVIWALAGYAIAISVPTVLDRSLSFYLLEKLQQRGGGIREDAFPKIVSGEFMQEYRVVDARLTEQIESGTIAIDNGCVVLTDKGRRIASFSHYFRQNFLPKQRLLMGQYSDDLTDPFRRSADNPDYLCHQN